MLLKNWLPTLKYTMTMLTVTGKLHYFIEVALYCLWITCTATSAAGMYTVQEWYWLDYLSGMRFVECAVFHDGITMLQYVVSCTAAITECPVSVTALVDTNVQFHCVGTGNYLVWEVDGLQVDNPNIQARGITAITSSSSSSSSGTVQSNLTVPATSVNNGTTVRCAISVSLFSKSVISNYSTLTVLPGEITSMHT